MNPWETTPNTPDPNLYKPLTTHALKPLLDLTTNTKAPTHLRTAAQQRALEIDTELFVDMLVEAVEAARLAKKEAEEDV